MNINIYTHIYIYILYNIYIYMYIMYNLSISATALCAFGVTGFFMLLSDFCYPDLSAFLFNRPPLIRMAMRV